MTDDLIKGTNLEKVVSQGSLFYEEIKSTYEGKDTGKFLAIDIDSKDKFLGNTSAEATAKARAAHPGNVFYVVKIGFDAVETLAHLTRVSQK